MRNFDNNDRHSRRTSTFVDGFGTATLFVVSTLTLLSVVATASTATTSQRCCDIHKADNSSKISSHDEAATNNGNDAALQLLFTTIDQNKNRSIQQLREFVAIRSVSVEPERRNETIAAVHWMRDKLEQLGARMKLVEMGVEERRSRQDGQMHTIPMPPVLIGELSMHVRNDTDDGETKAIDGNNNASIPTMLIYGHLDVQKAFVDDGWLTPPFNLTEKNGRLYGRGATDDKGPTTAWLAALQAYRQTNQTLKLNLKFLFESVEEVGSPKLQEFIDRNQEFLSNIDYVVISDNGWLSSSTPALTYGLRGLLYFDMVVDGPSRDLHSGGNGGSVFEPMHDVVALLASLTETVVVGSHITTRIAVDGVYDDVPPVTPGESAMYNDIDFESEACPSRAAGDHAADFENLSPSCTVPRWRQDGNATAILMSRWRFPSLTIHEISGGSGGTIIASRVNAKFSIRMVPNMKCEKIVPLVRAHLRRVLREELHSPNRLNLTLRAPCNEAWYTDPLGDDHYAAAAKAVGRVYGVEPDLTREGGSIPVARILSQAMNSSKVLLLPLGAADDGAHAQNEKIDVRNFHEGTKVLGAYLYEVARLSHCK